MLLVQAPTPFAGGVYAGGTHSPAVQHPVVGMHVLPQGFQLWLQEKPHIPCVQVAMELVGAWQSAGEQHWASGMHAAPHVL
jgi:hypothetical protein